MVGLVSESFYLKYAMHTRTTSTTTPHALLRSRAPRKEV